MAKIIVTKRIPATNTKGQRIKATCDAGSVTVAWDWSQDRRDAHQMAAQTLRAKLGWGDTSMEGGTLPGKEDQFAWVVI